MRHGQACSPRQDRTCEVCRSPFARESPTPDGSGNGKAGQRLPKREYEPEWGGTDLAGRCIGGIFPAGRAAPWDHFLIRRHTLVPVKLAVLPSFNSSPETLTGTFSS
jgi:hypothetical protein